MLCIAQPSVLIDGYTDKASYRAGETVTFFLNAVGTGSGGVGSLCLRAPNGATITPCINGIDMAQQSISSSNTEPWKNGFGYSASSVTWTVPSSLQSGHYILYGPGTSPPGFEIPIIIKGDKSTANIVVVCPTNTINAYTNSGGKSLYDYNSSNGIQATTVSFLRPQDYTQGLMTGFLKWFYNTYPSASHPSANVNVISDLDMDDYTEIENAKVLIVIGHSEYWSREARMNFDKFVDAGKDAIILSGNSFWWQVQYIDDNYSTDNTKLTVYRGTTDNNFNPTLPITADASCDPLLKTVHWNEPSLKYSILGSIGADWGDGYSNHPSYGDADNCYGGFYGHKIILPNSPILNGTGFAYGNYLTFPTGEYDATLIDGFDSNGDPILDVSALGFFHAEIIGYDRNNSSGITEYYPFILFQKTCTSGKIINVSSNSWCRDIGIGGNSHINPCTGQSVAPDAAHMKTITQNMIDMLLAGSNVFVSPAPTSITMKPSSQTVSYSACITNGSIHITPCGVFITDGYKVDTKDNTAFAKIEDCTSCNHSAKMSANNHGVNENPQNTKQPSVNIFPNPNNGSFSILSDSTILKIDIRNLLGENIYSSQINSNKLELNLSDRPKGIYFIKLYSTRQTVTRKIIVQ